MEKKKLERRQSWDEEMKVKRRREWEWKKKWMLKAVEGGGKVAELLRKFEGGLKGIGGGEGGLGNGEGGILFIKLARNRLFIE